MAEVKKVTLKRYNGTDNDDLHPTTSWDQIESKPTTFTPTAHTLNSHTDVNASPTANGQVLTWDADNSAWIASTTAGGGVSKSDLQNVYVYGKASGAITKGQAVQFAGAQGGHILIKTAVQSEINAAPNYMVGLAEDDIADTAFGYVLVNGRLNMDTSVWDEGDILYFDSAGSTAGALTTTEPGDPDACIEMAAVSVDGVGNGELLVRTTLLTRTIDEVTGLQAALDGKEPAVIKNTGFNKSFGNTAGTVVEGNDSRLSDARTPTTHTHSISDVTNLQTSLDAKVNKAGDTMTGDLTIAKNNAVLIFKDTSTPDNNNLAAWISFKDQNNSEKGWMGYGYTTDTNMTFSNTIGNINLTPGLNVGIGTTSPTDKLDVNGITNVYQGGQTALKTYSGKAGLQLVGYQSDSGSPYLKTSDIVANADGTVPSQMRLFTKASGDGSATERIRITSDGNVGIGTSSPSVKLDIYQSGNGASNSLLVRDDARQIRIGRDEIRAQDLSSNPSTLFINNSGGNTILNGASGNVGIGTTSPGQKLDVVGNIAVSGTVDGVDLSAFKTAYDSHTHTFASITSKPTTLSGYGITDAYTQTQVNSQISTAVSNLVNGANASFDTLKEIQDAMATDSELATAISNLTIGNGEFTVSAGGGITGGGVLGTANQTGNSGVTIAHADTSSQPSVNNSGRTYIQDITLDTYGHITGITSATETVVDTNTVTAIRRDNTGTYRTGNINLVGGSNVTITETSAGVFSFASTDTNTDTNNYLTGVSGSGDGTVTFTRQGLSNLTWDSSHSHSEYLSTSGKAADSNLLDGIDSSAFLRSNTADTATGLITLNTNSGSYGRLDALDQYHAIVLRGSVSGTSSQTVTAGNEMDFIEYGGIFNFRSITPTANTLVTQINGNGIDIQSGNIYADNQHGFINSGSWTRNATPYGYIDIGPANTSHAHIYTDRANFYFNKYLLINGQRVFADDYHPNADTWTTARTLTIGSTGKSVNGSGNVSWSLAEIGAAASSHTHDDRYYTESESDSRFLNASGDTSSGMQSFYTGMTSQDDWQNSPISIRERGAAGAGDGEDRDAPNLNFHWSARVSNSLWMNTSGILKYGDYSSTGIPSANGTIQAATFIGSLSGNASSATNAGTLDGIDSTGFLRVSANSSSPLNGNFAIGNASSRNFIQSHNSQPLDINPLGNAVTINSNAAFHDGYHPNADKWTTARTLSLTGDASGSTSWDGSGNASISVVVNNDSHTHDGRYYTESEADGRYVQQGGTSFSGTYPLVVRVSDRNFYSDGDITFTGSTSTLSVTGGVVANFLEATGGSINIGSQDDISISQEGRLEFSGRPLVNLRSIKNWSGVLTLSGTTGAVVNEDIADKKLLFEYSNLSGTTVNRSLSTAHYYDGTGGVRETRQDGGVVQGSRYYNRFVFARQSATQVTIYQPYYDYETFSTTSPQTQSGVSLSQTLYLHNIYVIEG